jgi:hypothetical protein
MQILGASPPKSECECQDPCSFPTELNPFLYDKNNAAKIYDFNNKAKKLSLNLSPRLQFMDKYFSW